MTATNTPGLALRFDVQIDGMTIATFTGCSGLSAEYEAYEWKEGGDNGTVTKLPGRLSYGNVKLTRPVDADSSKLAAWVSQQYRQPSRGTATIQLYDGNHHVVAKWTLAGAWPVCYTGPTLATTGEDGNAVAVESLELAHVGFLP